MFCGDMLHEFEVDWSTRRERIEAAAKKRPKSALVSSHTHVPSQGSNTTAATIQRQTVGSNMAVKHRDEISDNLATLNRSVQLTETQEEIPMPTSTMAMRSEAEPSVPKDTSSTGSTAHDIAPNTSLELVAVEPHATVFDGQEPAVVSTDQQSIDRMVQTADVTANLSPEEASVLGELAQQVINEAIEAYQEANAHTTPDTQQQYQNVDAEPINTTTVQTPLEAENRQYMSESAEQSATAPSIIEERMNGAVEATTDQNAVDNTQISSHSTDAIVMTYLEQNTPQTDNQPPAPEPDHIQLPESNVSGGQIKEQRDDMQVDSTDINAIEEQTPDYNELSDLIVPLNNTENIISEVPAATMRAKSTEANETYPSKPQHSMIELSRTRSERIKIATSEEHVTPTDDNTTTAGSMDTAENTGRLSTDLIITHPASSSVPLKLDPSEVTGETDPNEFDVGMKVWVKLKGYKWWPGQIVAKLTEDSFLVIFYSAESFAEVSASDPETKMVLFEPYLNILGPLTNKKALNESIAQQHDWHVYSADPKSKQKKTKRRKKKIVK